MGTRSLTFIHEMEDEYLKGDKVVCVFFRHFDGYPSGHGQDLADFLNGKKLVNGTMAVKLANHIQDISGAEIIHGDNYNYGQDHDYHVYFRNGEFCIQIDGMEPVKASEFNGKEMEKKLYED